MVQKVVLVLPLMVVLFIRLTASSLVQSLISNDNSNSYYKVYKNNYVHTKTILQIGGDNNDPNYILSAPLSFCVDRNEYIYILDRGDYKVKIYTNSGQYLNCFGRSGKGPGEFMHPNIMLLEPTGNLVIWDAAERKISYFTRDGKYLKQRRFNYNINKLQISNKNIYFIELRKSIRVNGKMRDLFKITSYSKEISNISEVFNRTMNQNISTNFGKQKWLVNIPFSHSVLWELNPQGNIVLGVNDDDFIYIKTPEGIIINKVKHNISKVKVKESDKIKYLSSFPEGIQKQAARQITFPDYKPYYQYIFVDDRSNIILKSYETDGDYVYYYAYSMNGSFINKFKSNKEAMQHNCIISNGHVYNIYNGPDKFAEVTKSILY